MQHLNDTPYIWVVPRDDNRGQDGIALRREFLREEHALGITFTGPCSLLEVLVALSRRLAFESEGEPAWWFWHMMQNLNIAHNHDDEYFEKEVEEVLTSLMFRTYQPNGCGGLFPLRNPSEDQRHVEIWYQAQAYILEGGFKE